MQRWVWLLAAGFIAIISVLALRGVVLRSVSRVRIAEYLGLDEDATEWDDEVSRGLLGRWLALAGYRSPRAGGVFLSLTGATTLLGLLLMFFISRSALIDFAIGALGNIPGAVGEIFVPVVRFGPWILVMILGFAPCAVVRARRRRIVREVEQDLPLVLELLATLGECRHGVRRCDRPNRRLAARQQATDDRASEFPARDLDRATTRRVAATAGKAPRRPIIDNLHLGHRPRRTGRLGHLRCASSPGRRRSRSPPRSRMNLAQSLPIKVLFPLVICFLPAIFVFTLGPVFVQFFQFAESILNRRLLR